MKHLLFSFILTFCLSIGYGQEGDKKAEKIPIIEKATDTKKNEIGDKSSERSRFSISSAARRRSLPNRNANNHRENEAVEKPEGNNGLETAEQATQLRGSTPSNRPNINVPAARPTPPVVRPGRVPGSPPRPRNIPQPPSRPNIP